MATEKPEIASLSLGMDDDYPDRGPVLVNLYAHGKAVQVREGFGQIGQWDCTQQFNDSDTASGVQEVLGAFAFRSNAGRVQVLTLLRTLGMTFDTEQGLGLYGQWAQQYMLHVYDVTANAHAEFALHTQTPSVSMGAVSPQDVRPWGNSDANADRIVPTRAEPGERAFFCEMADTVVFGTPAAGVWCYRPSMFEQVAPQAGTLLLLDSRMGEAAPLCRLSLEQGQFSYEYRPESAAPVTADVCVWDDRLVLGAGRTLYFSDKFNARGFIAGNDVTLPLQNEITAIATVFENLLVWTSTEFGIYRPKAGTFQTDGSWRLVSGDAGCAGPGAKLAFNQGVVWLGKRGVFASSGQYDAENAAPALKSLVTEGFGNPLSAFLMTQQGGYTPPTGETPRLQWEWRDLDKVSMAYEPLRDRLLVLFPSEQAVLCRTGNQWSIWTAESRASNFATTVGISSLDLQALCAVDGRVFAAAGPETFSSSLMADQETTASWYLLELGRGGGIDRSVEYGEDNRQHLGWWTHHGAVAADDPVISFGKPIELWQGWTASAGGNAVGAGGAWLIPVTVQPSDAANGQPVGYIDADVTFDDTRWAPLLVGAGPAIDVVWPNERLLTSAGWVINRPAANQISLTYNSVIPLNLSRRLEQPLFYIAMTRVTTQPSTGCAWAIAPATVPFVGVSAAFNVQARIRTWRQFDRTSTVPLTGAYMLHNNDDAAQPVDWALKGAQLDGGGQVRLREMFLRVLTHAQGTSGIAAAWPWGLLNAYYSSDWKDWSGQIVDWSGWQNELVAKTVPARSRVKDATAAMIRRVFDGGLKWGSTADATKGNYLVDDEQVDTIAISDSVRGETISVLLFGHVRDRAEKMVLREVVTRVLKMGGRRRIGR
jgi:hypothetical protein